MREAQLERCASVTVRDVVSFVDHNKPETLLEQRPVAPTFKLQTFGCAHDHSRLCKRRFVLVRVVTIEPTEEACHRPVGQHLAQARGKLLNQRAR